MASNQQGAGSNRGGSGNVASDPQRASEAGKKGGEHSHGNQASGHQPASTQQGNGSSGGFSENRGKAADAGRKGGQR
jgi:general stress protein YciG